MRKGSRLGVLARWVAALALAAGVATGTAAADPADPPGRAARLSDIEGSVALQPAGASEWTAATLNRPLTTGDRIWSDENSRAELDMGAAVMWLGAGTGFSFLNLDDDTVQMQLSAGTLIVRVRELPAGQSYEVDTANLALLLQQPGEYRIEASEAGDVTVVKVSQGAAQASGGGQTVAIGTQQAVMFSGSEQLAYESGTLGAPDDLDAWSAARERQAEDSPSREYVADDVAGTQDLDNNGTWQSTPDYGFVWVPTVVAVGWAPYRFGHWVWIAPWGWTWVDDARWGYAPSHYGRWVRYHSDWCWVPGPRRGRPVYAPALVGWVGGAVPGGGVGWFPLGPREVYVPPYQVSQAYVRRVNITNTTIVNNLYITNVYQRNLTPLHYVNNTVAAVTAVPQAVFTSGQRVGGHTVRLPAADLEAATVSAAAPAIAPVRQSVLGPAPTHGGARPPAQLLNRPVMARTPPPRAPVPLERQLAAIQANGGRPLARADLAGLQPAAAATAVRMITATGPVVSAATLPRGAPSVRPAVRPQTSAAATAQPGLIERERALQNSRVTTAPPLPSYPPPAAVHDAAGVPPSAAAPPVAARTTGAPPAWREERPPAVETHPSTPQRGALAPDDAAHAYAHPPALPVYRPPGVVSSTAASAARAGPLDEVRPRAPVLQPRFSPPPAPPLAPPPRVAPAVAPSHGGAPARVSEPDPRGGAAHGDRSSRDRAER
ncbi:MAG TPA: DUF6600 domain-containing protein [Steroidobacteraceae bacterium]|nr:DUF6600 domain-containing protein [Steroidobacteraceae bacterium]